jgi:fluoride exporter
VAAHAHPVRTRRDPVPAPCGTRPSAVPHRLTVVESTETAPSPDEVANDSYGIACGAVGSSSEHRRLGLTTRRQMAQVLLIGLAGALGTLSRYYVGVWAARTIGAGFPYGTLIVNLVGCFLIALIYELALTTALISPSARLVLTTGFMGGLTTYSSFNYETTGLLRERAWATGLLNLGVTLAGCFVAGLLGLALARRIAGT